MQEKEVTLLFNSGDLKSAQIVPHILSTDWVVLFARKGGEQIALDSQRTTPRLFKTLDAAFKVCHEIGFQEVKVFTNGCA